MALVDMKVFNDFVRQATIETVAQEIDKFNAASNGSIVLSAEGFGGDFFQTNMFKSLHGAQRRVDRYAANGAQAATNLEQIEQNVVKVAGGFGPVLWEPSQLTWVEQNQELAIEAISRNLAEAIMQDQLNTAILSAIAGISNIATLTNDISATAGLSLASLNNTHALMGDRSTMLIAQVMNGTAYHKLIGENITNTSRLYEFNSIRILDVLGKVTVVTDAPALYEAGTPNKLKVLTLVAGGVFVNDASDLVTNIETKNGNQRIETTMQADYAFGVGIKGLAWDIANGGKSPDDTDLGTGTNWDQYVTSIKDVGGVVTIVDADQ